MTQSSAAVFWGCYTIRGTLLRTRMTKHKNSSQRTPQSEKRDHPRKNQQDPTSRQVAGTTSAPSNQEAGTTQPLPAVELPIRITQVTPVVPSVEELQRTLFSTPHQTVPAVNNMVPPGAPNRDRVPNTEAEILALTEDAPDLTLGNFVSQNYETQTALMQEEARRRASTSLQARLNFGPEREPSSLRHPRGRRAERTTIHDRLGTTSNSQYSEDSERRTNVHSRLGSRGVHDRLGPQHSPSQGSSKPGNRTIQDRWGRRRSPSRDPSSPSSERSRRKRRKRDYPSSSNSSDNEDKETGHWKSRGRRREEENEDMSLPWLRQKIDAFTWRISDYSDLKRRRMPTNVKTYDGTGDPDDHLKIFESAATIENWPQPVWCHMFNSTLVGNARTWFSKLPRRSIGGFEELRKAFRLNFTQRKKCAKNPVELARVKQRQGESTSAFMERFKDECIQVKTCPEVLKISGFMNGINNPELIRKLNDKVPQTFDELTKRTRSFIQGEAAAADSKKGYSNYKQQEQPRRQSNDQNNNRSRNYRSGRDNDKYTPLTKTPREIFVTEGSNFPKPLPMRTAEEKRIGSGYCEYHGQKGHTTNECVQLKQLIEKLVREGRMDHLVKNIKEGKDKQRNGGKKEPPKEKADIIYMIQSWQRKTKQKVSQKFSSGKRYLSPP